MKQFSKVMGIGKLYRNGGWIIEGGVVRLQEDGVKL